MGPVDYIENPALSAALSPELNQNLQLHLPELLAPTLEDILEDRLEVGHPSTSGTSATRHMGPVDIADASGAARRFFED